MPGKKVLLIVIDALASRVVQPAVSSGVLPNFARLIERGAVGWNCTSIFPSITPAATATLATGCYPSEHGIVGGYWYDEAEDDVAYYGDDFWVILTEGFSTFFEDFLVKLNQTRLNAQTVFSRVEGAGRTAGCLNFLWFHGPRQHSVDVPLLLKLWPGVPFTAEVPGPTILYLGDFVSTRIGDSGERLSGPGGLQGRYGFQDSTTALLLLELARAGELPDFTLAYFPDNDFDSHADGPLVAQATLQRVDVALGELIATCGGPDRLLRDFSMVITGDHSQSDLTTDEQGRGIRLDEVLSDFSQCKPGAKWQPNEDLLICPNMRAAQIYVHRPALARWQDIVARLLAEPRIDQVIWPDDPESAKRRFHVATRDRGRLSFWAGGDGDQSATDDYGTRWAYSGSLDAVGATVVGGRLDFGDYPNACERIANAFPDEAGALWATARLGHEFEVAETGIHRRGSHAALNALDSTVPLIVAGAGGYELPPHPRTVDVVPICLELLGMEAFRRPGAPHVKHG